MPHLVLEYTANLEKLTPDPRLSERLHRILESSAGVAIENCKSRWHRVENWVVGDGKADAAFVHLELRLLEGRPPHVLEAVGREALGVLRDHFRPAPGKTDLQITVAVGELVRAAYFKDPEGTLSPPPRKEA